VRPASPLIAADRELIPPTAPAYRVPSTDLGEDVFLLAVEDLVDVIKA
jgi:hypothetical protein